jgi:hypothetical protein
MKIAGMFILSVLLVGCALIPGEALPESGSPLAEAASTQPVPSQPAPTQAMQLTESFHAGLPDYGTAPELHNQVWLNTDRPLRLADLRGKVVLVDMWTFG